jgi:hypothetical protein
MLASIAEEPDPNDPQKMFQTVHLPGLNSVSLAVMNTTKLAEAVRTAQEQFGQIAGGGFSVKLQFWFDVCWTDPVCHGCQLKSTERVTFTSIPWSSQWFCSNLQVASWHWRLATLRQFGKEGSPTSLSSQH